MVRCKKLQKKHKPVQGKKKHRKDRKKSRVQYVTDNRLREVWDEKLTTKQNLTKYTLKELYYDSLPDPEDIPEKGKERKLCWRDADVVRDLVAKFGDDAARMARDHKTNIYQWSERECRLRVERLKKGLINTEHQENLAGRGLDQDKVLSRKQKQRNEFGH
mmetsp:Transcript_41896/g.100677  ORF Transcript_41896/g.100677 Transcript_41896/m.100677 type:complete len:161 (-) Transcript_41896:8-490(-)